MSRQWDQSTSVTLIVTDLNLSHPSGFSLGLNLKNLVSTLSSSLISFRLCYRLYNLVICNLALSHPLSLVHHHLSSVLVVSELILGTLLTYSHLTIITLRLFVVLLVWGFILYLLSWLLLLPSSAPLDSLWFSLRDVLRTCQDASNVLTWRTLRKNMEETIKFISPHLPNMEQAKEKEDIRPDDC